MPIDSFAIHQVGKPAVGETFPAKVEANITLSLFHYSTDIRSEWDALRPRDVLYLISMQAPASLAIERWAVAQAKGTSFAEFFGIQRIRGCEVIEFISDEGQLMLDENGKPFNEEERTPLKSAERTIRVQLDPVQYQQDLRSMSKGGGSDTEIYSNFNIVLRRRAQDNNGKAVLETIRDLLRSPVNTIVPDWFLSLFLGYGDPKSAHYSQLIPKLSQEIGVSNSIHFQDAIIDWKHLLESFPDAADIKPISLTADQKHLLEAVQKIQKHFGLPSLSMASTLPPPFEATFESTAEEPAKKKKKSAAPMMESKESITVRTIPETFAGPYAEDQPRKNTKRFYPRQVEAIRSGCSPGLTLIAGPPGTGKSDVAAQIVSNLYKSHPNKRTLIITRSNQALNQLFAKLTKLDIDDRHLLRLGHGDEMLNGSFGKYGRVSAFLARRIELLGDVDRLAKSLQVQAGDVASSCETAFNFYLYHIRGYWLSFHDKWSPLVSQQGKAKDQQGKAKMAAEDLAKDFVFQPFFDNSPPVTSGVGLFPKDVTAFEALEIARGCWRHIKEIFAELEEIRALEVVRSGYDRTNYLVTKEARIIAMTCTYAAVKVGSILLLLEVVLLNGSFHSVAN